MKATTQWTHDDMRTRSSLTKDHKDIIAIGMSCVTETMIFIHEHIEAEVKSGRGNLQNFTEGPYEHSKNVISEKIQCPVTSIFSILPTVQLNKERKKMISWEWMCGVDVSSLTHSLEEFTDVRWWKECGEPFRDNISPKWFRSGPATLHFRPQVCNRP